MTKNNSRNNQNQFVGFMGQVEFRSNIAEFSKMKNANAYVDSGANCHFLYRLSSFSTHKAIKVENTKGVNATSKIIVKGTVTVPIGNGINVEVDHATKFSSNVIPVGLLQKNFEIVFSESIHRYPVCFFVKKETMNIIYEVKLNDGLCPLIWSTLNPNSCQANATKKNKSIDKWERKLGNFNPSRLNKLSELNSSILTFDREINNQHQCAPCLVGNSKQSYTLSTSQKTTRTLELIYLDISGPVQSSLEGYRYTDIGVDDLNEVRNDLSI